MATHDYVIANGTGAAVRSDINGALAAIVSHNSDASAPATTYAYMLWADTSAGQMKMRNGANSAWVTLWELDGTLLATDISLGLGSASAPSLFFTGDPNTGIYSPGVDQVAITTGGTGRVFVDTNGNIGVGTSPTNVAGSKRLDIGVASASDGLLTLRSSVGAQEANIANGSGGISIYTNSYATPFTVRTSEVIFGTGSGSGVERFRINSVGLTTVTPTIAEAAGAFSVAAVSRNTSLACFAVDEGFWNTGANTAAVLGRNSVTDRSINAGGTINASGADYAEYMVKAGNFVIAKGDICGVTANGKLTNVFADAVGFLVKSTDPSYVGGDTWGSESIVGVKPTEDTPDLLAEWEAAAEAERQKVDRIAFSGQVPVNVTGATPGQYIIPSAAVDGGITGIAKDETDLTLFEYMQAVGKVIAIEDDGRARIIVKVA